MPTPTETERERKAQEKREELDEKMDNIELGEEIFGARDDIQDALVSTGTEIGLRMAQGLGHVIGKIPYIGPIGEIVAGVAKLTLKAKYNKQDAEILSVRAKEAYVYLEGLVPKLQNRTQDELKQLFAPVYRVFKEIEEMHKNITKEGFMKFLKNMWDAGSDADTISKLEEKLKKHMDDVARGLQAEQFELQLKTVAKIDEILEKMEQAGPRGLDSKQMADFAVQAGCTAAAELQGELQGMGFQLSEIQDAVSAVSAKLDQMDAKMDQGFAEQRQGFQDLKKGQDATLLTMQLEFSRRAQHDEAQKRFLQDLRAEKGLTVNPVFTDNAGLLWLRDMANILEIKDTDVVVRYDGISTGANMQGHSLKSALSAINGADGTPGQLGRDETVRAQNARAVGGHGLNGKDGGNGGDGDDGEDGKDLENLEVIIALKEENESGRTYKIKFQSARGNSISGEVGDITFKVPKVANFESQEKMPRIHIVAHGGDGGQGGTGGRGGKGQDGGHGANGTPGAQATMANANGQQMILTPGSPGGNGGNGGAGGDGGDGGAPGCGGHGGKGPSVTIRSFDPDALALFVVDASGGKSFGAASPGQKGNPGQGGCGGLGGAPGGINGTDGRTGKEGKTSKASVKRPPPNGANGSVSFCLMDPAGNGDILESAGAPYYLVFDKKDSLLQPKSIIGNGMPFEDDGYFVYGEKLSFGPCVPINKGGMSSPASHLDASVRKLGAGEVWGVTSKNAPMFGSILRSRNGVVGMLDRSHEKSVIVDLATEPNRGYSTSYPFPPSGVAGLIDEAFFSAYFTVGGSKFPMCQDNRIGGSMLQVQKKIFVGIPVVIAEVNKTAFHLWSVTDNSARTFSFTVQNKYRKTSSAGDYSIVLRAGSDDLAPALHSLTVRKGNGGAAKVPFKAEGDQRCVTSSAVLPSLNCTEKVEIGFDCAKTSGCSMGSRFAIRLELWRNNTMLQYSAPHRVRVVAPNPPPSPPSAPTCLIVAYEEMLAADHATILRTLSFCGIEVVFMDSVHCAKDGITIPKGVWASQFGKATLVLMPPSNAMSQAVPQAVILQHLQAGGGVVTNARAPKITIKAQAPVVCVPEGVGLVSYQGREASVDSVQGVSVTKLLLSCVAGLSFAMKLSLLSGGTTKQHNVQLLSMSPVDNYTSSLEKVTKCLFEAGSKIAYKATGQPSKVTLKDVLLACLYIDMEKELASVETGEDWKKISHLNAMPKFLEFAKQHTHGPSAEAVQFLVSATLIRNSSRPYTSDGWADFCKKNIKVLPRGDTSKQGMARRLREVAQLIVKFLQMPQPSKLAQKDIDISRHCLVEGVAPTSMGALQGSQFSGATIVGGDLVTKGQPSTPPASAWA